MYVLWLFTCVVFNNYAIHINFPEVVARAHLGGEGQHGRYMAKVKSVTDHENVSFGIRSRLAKRIIPHSIPDPERLFSSVRKIVIDHRTRLDSSTDVI